MSLHKDVLSWGLITFVEILVAQAAADVAKKQSLVADEIADFDFNQIQGVMR